MFRPSILPLCFVAFPAAAQTLPPGFYDCTLGSSYLGNMVMKGDKYRGPVYGNDFEGPSNSYSMDGPTITWGGPVGGISLAGTIVSTVAKGTADGTLSGFDITVQMAESGNFQNVSCYPVG